MTHPTSMTERMNDSAQEIVDVFFAAGATVSKEHYDKTVAILSTHTAALREEVRKKIVELPKRHDSRGDSWWVDYHKVITLLSLFGDSKEPN